MLAGEVYFIVCFSHTSGICSYSVYRNKPIKAFVNNARERIHVGLILSQAESWHNKYHKQGCFERCKMNVKRVYRVIVLVMKI